MTCEHCDGQCSCHINSPCSFCESHMFCERCGELVCEDKAEEFTDSTDGSKLLLCPDCVEETQDAGDHTKEVKKNG